LPACFLFYHNFGSLARAQLEPGEPAAEGRRANEAHGIRQGRDIAGGQPGGKDAFFNARKAGARLKRLLPGSEIRIDVRGKHGITEYGGT